MFYTGEVVWMFSFCLEAISINSVILSVSLLVINHLPIFSTKSLFKQD